MNKNRQDSFGNVHVYLFLALVTGLGVLLGIERAKKGEPAVPPFFFASLGCLGLRFMIASARKKMIPGCLWLSLICRDMLVVFIIGVVIHLFHSPFPECVFSLTDIVSLLKSPLPMDHLMVVAYYEFVLAGILLNLKRRETRKRALIAFLAWLVLFMIFYILYMFLQIPAMPRNTILTAVTSVWPLYCGVSGALFRRRYGKAAQAAYDAKMKAKQARRAAVPTPGAFSSQPPAKPAQAVPVPRSAPVRTVPNPVPEVPQVSRSEKIKQKESLLKSSLEKYLEQKEKANAAVQMIPAGMLLPLASQRLYPGGEWLSHLDGQRQLFLWLSALPCLRSLRTSDAAVRFLEETLPDDPEHFLPVLNAVVRKAEQLLSDRFSRDRENWTGLDGETLTGVWFALRMYQRMSNGSTVFDEAAKAIETYMDTQPGLLGWLQQFSGEEKSL